LEWPIAIHCSIIAQDHKLSQIDWSWN
jgi:hypothetical protein